MENVQKLLEYILLESNAPRDIRCLALELYDKEKMGKVIVGYVDGNPVSIPREQYRNISKILTGENKEGTSKEILAIKFLRDIVNIPLKDARDIIIRLGKNPR